MTLPHFGQFITPRSSTGAEGEPAAYFRRVFHLDKEPIRATLRVTALGVFEAQLNGHVVGDEVLSPGWTSYRHRLLISEHDVTKDVVLGENVLGAIVGEGWALGRLGWENKRNHYASRPALFTELVIEHTDGTYAIVTNEEFRASSGGVRENSIYDGETFDANLEPIGWAAPGFDDSEWGDVEIVSWPHEALTTTSAEPIRRIEELAPVDLTPRHPAKQWWTSGRTCRGACGSLLKPARVPRSLCVTLRSWLTVRSTWKRFAPREQRTDTSLEATARRHGSHGSRSTASDTSRLAVGPVLSIRTPFARW